MRTGSEVSPKTSVDSGFTAASATAAAALVAVVSLANLTGFPGACGFGIKSGHHMAEEAPDERAGALISFFR